MRDRQPFPKHIQDAPELLLGLEFTYGAFIELNGEREIGMSCGPIPWSAVASYAVHHELDEEETEDLVQLVREMDAAFLRYHDEEAKSKIGKK